jgi:PAS domain S-box-containing protein
MGSSTSGGDAAAARRRLADAISPNESFPECAERALEVDVDYLGVESGHVTAVDTGASRWEVIAATDSPVDQIEPGSVSDLHTTYCRVTVDAGGSVAAHDVGAAEWVDEATYRAQSLDCYHGTVVRVQGDVYGTVCFVDRTPRETPFTDGETAFAELVAEKLGRVIERRRYEQESVERSRALQTHREWLRGIMEVSSDVVFRVDQDGEFTFVSDRCEELLGYTPQRLHGDRFTRVVAAESVDSARSGLTRAQAGEQVTLRGLTLDGVDERTVHADVRLVAVPSDDGTEAVQGVVDDITDRWRFEQVSCVLNRVLRHNLRNAMNVVLGNAKQVQRRCDGESATLAGEIEQTAEQLLELGETAQTMERRLRDEISVSTVDVVTYVRAAVAEARESYPHVTFEVDTPRAAFARATPTVETVVGELLDNAARYAGGPVTVGVRVDETTVTVSVGDDGPGLDPGDERLLESGEETEVRHGSGLGLLLVYWLATGMDGGVDATVDDGTTVEITLGRADEPSE